MPKPTPDYSLRRAAVRTTVPEVYQVHDHGSVEVDAVFGDEEDIVRRARITTKKMGLDFKADRSLLRYLWTNGHTSPFDFCHVTLLVRAPIFVARQWFRHRTGTRNEVGDVTYVETDDDNASHYHAMQEFSGRYAPYEPAFYIPTLDYLQGQSEKNHQARNGLPVDDADLIQNVMRNVADEVADLRTRWMEQGLAREVARIVTPLNQYTEWYWQQSLPNLLHWLTLRREYGAQLEIRDYAQVVEHIVQRYYPNVYAVWLEGVQGAKLSRDDVAELLQLLYGKAVSNRLGRKLGLVD